MADDEDLKSTIDNVPLKERFVREMFAKQGRAEDDDAFQEAGEQLVRAALDGDEAAVQAATARLRAIHASSAASETD